MAVISYNFNDNTQLSPHFNVQEFRCKCSKNHENNQNSERISSKLVCCTAQNLGFGGIANTDTTYTAIHLDVRTSNIWYGNEDINYHTVTDDFCRYYGIILM